MAETQTDREPGTGMRSLDGAETVTRVLHATITITMIVTIISTIHIRKKPEFGVHAQESLTFWTFWTFLTF